MVEKKFTINGTEIRTARAIKDFFRRNKVNVKEVKIQGAEIGKQLIGLDKKYDFEMFFETLVLLSKKEIIGHKLASFIKDVESENFDPKRYLLYLEYRKKNSYDSNSDEFFKLKFGNHWKEKRDSLFKERPNHYNVDYISKKMNLNTKEALLYVEKFKKNKATSKDKFIERWGVEEGLKKFTAFQESSKHTKKKYLEKYGKIEGLKKWTEYLAIKKSKSTRCIDYWINKGYGEEQAEELRKEFHRQKLNTSSVSFWINKGMCQEDAENKVRDIFKKKQVAFAKSSKQSLVYFNPIREKLEKKGINDIYLGVSKCHEYSIYDKINKKLNFYDFTIPSLNIVIEYHGEKYHPNPHKLNKSDWDKWNCYALSGKKEIVLKVISADEKYALDQQKKRIAIERGFEFIELWSSDSFDTNWEKIKTVFKSKKIEL